MKIEAEKIKEVLSHLASKDSESVEILQEPIDIIANEEFISYLKVNKEDLLNTTENVLKLENKLYSKKTSNNRKKDIIAAISLEGSIKAYRILEKFLETEEGNLKQWVQIAKQQLKIKVERSLMDKKKIYISSGLGGKNNLIRLFGVAYLTYDSLRDYQIKIVKKELIEKINNAGGILEDLDIQDKYFTFKVLLPIHIDIDNLFKSMKIIFDQYGHFIKDNITITNVRKPSKNEIERNLKTLELLDLKKEIMHN